MVTEEEYRAQVEADRTKADQAEADALADKDADMQEPPAAGQATGLWTALTEHEQLALIA